VPTTDTHRFNPAERWKEGARYIQPALIAMFQRPDDVACAVHRIYLRPDFSGHDGKKMLGGGRGCVVKIRPPERGLLGIAEEIETSLCASTLFDDVTGWAAGSDGGLKNFGRWLVEHPGWAWSVGIRRLGDMGRPQTCGRNRRP
jgi:hypothetical protein